jgi:hypothetical protein
LEVKFSNIFNNGNGKVQINICIFIGFVCDFIDYLCEFTVKTTEHTVASYESSDFTWKFFTVYGFGTSCSDIVKSWGSEINIGKYLVFCFRSHSIRVFSVFLKTYFGQACIFLRAISLQVFGTFQVSRH